MTTGPTSKPAFAVLGAGHGGLAMAGHLALMGHTVSLYNRSQERIWGVITRGGIQIESECGPEGFGKLKLATTDMRQAVEDADVLMVVVPATAHRSIAEAVAPHLRDGHIVVLNPGRTFGALEFKQVLTAHGVTKDVIVAEAQTFLYASRAIGPGQARIFGIKNSIPVASVRAHMIPSVLRKLRTAFPQFVAGDNIFKTSLDNIGAVFHPTLCVLNAGWIEAENEFEFYSQGATPSVSQVLEAVDQERVLVAETLGIRALTARQWLFMAYHSVGATLYEAIRANPGYRGILAPNRLRMRYITEDVPTSLVPIASVGRKFKVDTPAIDSIIRLASTLNQTDYWACGRTVESLGIHNMTLRELRLLAIGEGA